MADGQERVAAKVSWSDLCPACKGYPDQGHRYDATCKEERPAATTPDLVEAAEWFIECAYPPGAKYEVGKRFLFWQARDRLKKAIEEAQTDA